ncbi:MAG TPA: hypothetical protein PLH23_00180 [Hyphomonadaceae bacterium]|nr:hypothetical protein [Hyphomonadaceae bacterium]HPI46652.1 hypothetical protein [Hyphomonadaceae bacterium]
MNRPATTKKQLELLDLTISTSRSDGVHGRRRKHILMFRRLLIPALAALLIATPAVAQRGNHFQRGDGFPSSQWDQSRGDREPQREVSLNSVQRQLQSRYGGQMLDAQKAGDRYIISWITKDGRRLTIEVDATNGRVLSTR